MFADVITKLKKLFEIDSAAKSDIEQVREMGYVMKYEDISEFNIISILAGKLANIVCSEADAEIIPVVGSNSRQEQSPCPTDQRIEFLNGGLKNCLSKLHLITARAFGTGGVVLKPYIYNNALYADVIPQDRFFVIERHGEIITKAGFIADYFIDDGKGNIGANTVRPYKKPQKYMRVEYHSLDPDGTYRIQNKAILITDKDKDNGITEIALAKIPRWADIPPAVAVSNVDQMLFAFVKCPADNRKDPGLSGGIYGVPITYGQDKLIKMILDLLNEIPDEYKNKKAFIGADDLLFDKDSRLPESGLYKLFRSGGGIDKQSFWEIFSPEIRCSSYFDGLDYLFGLLEKAVSVNKGMLTDLNVANATATAIKRSTLDTFSTVDAMRKNIEEAVNKLVYAFDVIACAFNLCPPGTKDYKVKFDWNYRLLEESSESWKQLLEGYHAGAVKIEELRMYLFGEDRETAKSFNEK